MESQLTQFAPIYIYIYIYKNQVSSRESKTTGYVPSLWFPFGQGVVLPLACHDGRVHIPGAPFGGQVRLQDERGLWSVALEQSEALNTSLWSSKPMDPRF